MSQGLLRIIHGKINMKCEQDLSSDELGFRLGYYTRSTLQPISTTTELQRSEKG